MQPKIVMITIIAMLASSTATGQDVNSVNYILPGCRVVAQGSVTVADEIAPRVGFCTGKLDALMWSGRLYPADRSFCLPPGTTVAQAAAVIVKRLEQMPERWHE